MPRLVRAQAQAAPEAVEQEHAQRAAEHIGEGMKKGSEHGGRPEHLAVSRVRPTSRSAWTAHRRYPALGMSLL